MSAKVGHKAKMRKGLSILVVVLLIIFGCLVFGAITSPVCYRGQCEGDWARVTYTLAYPISPVPNTPLNPITNPQISIQPNSIVIRFVVSSNIPIVEGTEISLSGVGTASPRTLMNVSEVSLTFSGATFYNIGVGLSGSGYNIGNGYGIGLVPNMTAPKEEIQPYLGEYLEGPSTELSFSQQGNYLPLLTIEFNNGTKPIQQTYQSVAIDVLSNQVLQNARYNEVNLALTYALVGFGFIEAIKTLADLNLGHSD